MKKVSIISSVIITVLSVISCQKILDNLLTFPVKTSYNFTIPGTPVAGIVPSIATPEISSSSNNEFSDNGSSVDLVKQAKLEVLTMRITSPSNETFSFLSEIKIYINADGLAETLIASKSNIPENVGNEINLETTGTDLAAYVKKGSYSIKVDVVTDKIVTEEVKITSDMTFQVTADPL